MLTDVHKSFLKACANLGCMKQEVALEILQETLETFKDTRICNIELLDEILQEINDVQKYLDHEIIKTKHELSPHTYIVFVYKRSDQINEFQPKNEIELSYFAALVNEIAADEDHCVNIIHAINMSFDLKQSKLNKQVASDLIDMWVENGQLIKYNNDGMLYLGPRAISELGIDILVKFPKTVHVCDICRSVSFYGIKCGNEDCDIICHRKCITDFLQDTDKCTQCNRLWLTDPSL